MKIYCYLTLAWATFALPILAASHIPPARLPTDPSLTEPVSQTSFSSSQALSPSLELDPQVSILSPSVFILSRNNATANYWALSGMRTFSLGLTRALGRIDNFYGFWTFRAGYGAAQSNVDVYRNMLVQTESAHLNWIPLSIALKAAYQGSHNPILKPWLVFGAGTEITIENSSDLALNNTFWIPNLFGSVGVTFLPGEYRDWFGGFDFGLSYQHSVGTSQTLRGWSYDLAVTLFL